MTDWTRTDPSWVDLILDWRWTWLCARLALCSAYILGGFTKVANFQAATAEQEHFGLHPGAAWAAAAIIVELGGSALVVAGRFAWLGTGAMGVLTAIAMIAANDFWDRSGADRFAAINAFFEHFGLIAGLVMAALLAEHDNRRHQPMVMAKLGVSKNE